MGLGVFLCIMNSVILCVFEFLGCVFLNVCHLNITVSGVSPKIFPITMYHECLCV